jgi:predicted RNA binding protein YcfA (HicA-like mRNA interferase family)
METNRYRIISRLEREGWINKGGGEHDKFRHPQKPGVIIVPRHRELSVGVSRSVHKAAGWERD